MGSAKKRGRRAAAGRCEGRCEGGAAAVWREMDGESVFTGIVYAVTPCGTVVGQANSPKHDHPMVRFRATSAMAVLERRQ